MLILTTLLLGATLGGAAPRAGIPDDLTLVLSRSTEPGVAPDVAALARTVTDAGVDRVILELGVDEVLYASLGLGRGAGGSRAWFVTLARTLEEGGVDACATLDGGAAVPELRAAAAGILRELVEPCTEPGVVFALDAPGVDAAALFRLWGEGLGGAAPVVLGARIDPADGRLTLPVREHLAGLAARIDATFGRDLLRAAVQRGGATHGSSSAAEPAAGALALIDGRDATAWRPAADAALPGWAEVRLAEPIGFDRIWVEGDGGAVTRFRVLARSVDEDWRLVADGRAFGVRTVLECAWTEAREVRLVVDAASGPFAVRRLALFATPPAVTVQPPRAISLSPIPVRLASRAGAEIRYTLDGSPPTASSPLFTDGLRVERTAVLRARAFDGRGGAPDETRAHFTVVTEDDWLPAVQFVKPPDPGLRLEVFEVALDSVVELKSASPMARRDVPDLDVERDRSRAQQVALRYRGYLRVPADGLFTFALASDDGSQLHIQDRQVVDNDGHHGVRRQEGKVPLRAGFHPFELTWFNGTGPGRLEVRWSGPSVGRDAVLPKEALFR